MLSMDRNATKFDILMYNLLGVTHEGMLPVKMGIIHETFQYAIVEFT